MNVGIYQITHKDTGRLYIGQSKNLKRREAQYRSVAGGGGSNSVIKRAIMKYGWDAFEFRVIVYCDVDMLDTYEINLIATYDCLAPKGFNVQLGGNDRTVTEETKQLISAANSGRVHSAEARQKMSDAQTARWATTEATDAQRDNARLLGMVIPTEETREKMSQALRERGQTNPASFANFRGKKHSAETREKMRQSHLKRYEEKRRSANG